MPAIHQSTTTLSAMVNAQAKSEGHGHETKVPNVLLIEDNPGDVALAVIAFEANGMKANFQTVVNGTDAIALLQRIGISPDTPRPDVILLDLKLPDVDGCEVLSFIKKQPNLRKIPTVILTSSDAPKDHQRCLALGADAYFCKPMSLPELLEMMKKIESILG